MSEIKKAIETLEEMEQQIKDLQEAKAGFYEQLKVKGFNTTALKLAVKYKMMTDNDRCKFNYDLKDTSDYLEEVEIQLSLFSNPVLKAAEKFHDGLAEHGMKVTKFEGNTVHIHATK